MLPINTNHSPESVSTTTVATQTDDTSLYSTTQGFKGASNTPLTLKRKLKDEPEMCSPLKRTRHNETGQSIKCLIRKKNRQIEKLQQEKLNLHTKLANQNEKKNIKNPFISLIKKRIPEMDYAIKRLPTNDLKNLTSTSKCLRDIDFIEPFPDGKTNIDRCFTCVVPSHGKEELDLYFVISEFPQMAALDSYPEGRDYDKDFLSYYSMVHELQLIALGDNTPNKRGRRFVPAQLFKSKSTDNPVKPYDILIKDYPHDELGERMCKDSDSQHEFYKKVMNTNEQFRVHFDLK